ncbi:MAG: 2-oxoacid:acceptor oxidoreductase family protein [Dehalococcoidia bacterium]
MTVGIAGAGGDGVVVLGSLLQKIAATQGYYGQMPRYYGAQIRGGGSAVKLILDGERPSLPGDTLDLMVCFDWEKYLEVDHELPLAPDTIVLFENEPAQEVILPEKSFKVDFSSRSREVTGSTRGKNIMALGLLTRVLSIPGDAVREAIALDEEFALLRDNLSAFEAGEELASEFSFPELGLAPARSASAKTVLTGNSAMARAAIRVGCRAFFSYPITPASELMQEMERELGGGNGVFLQAEDEIAAAGLALGASLAGAKAMTATSGPGLDLMTEMMGLASAAEIPMLIVDVQRCGPSTGIPSKSEQSDLDHAIYGGHGDASRVVLAPCDVEGCYRSIIEGMGIAQRFQAPVIVLSDQWLGQTLVAVDGGFQEDECETAERLRAEGPELEGYRRYRLRDDFISPISDVGDAGLAYRTTGLSHNESGAPASDFETHQRLHVKRRKKLAPLSERDDLVSVWGSDESSRGIITWGSSAQFVLEAVKCLGLEGVVKVCVPELICPLPRKVERFVSSVEKLLVVEMNYSGQLHRYLRSELDLPKGTEVWARVGGRPFSRSELAGPIGGIAK